MAHSPVIKHAYNYTIKLHVIISTNKQENNIANIKIKRNNQLIITNKCVYNVLKIKTLEISLSVSERWGNLQRASKILKFAKRIIYRAYINVLNVEEKTCGIIYCYMF